jgi:hypothetical protein
MDFISEFLNRLFTAAKPIHAKQKKKKRRRMTMKKMSLRIMKRLRRRRKKKFNSKLKFSALTVGNLY